MSPNTPNLDKLLRQDDRWRFRDAALGIAVLTTVAVAVGFLARLL